MAARVCPYCRELNSVTEPRCFRCGRRLPGPVSDGALKLARELLGVEAPVTRLLLLLELAVFGLCLVVNRSFSLDGLMSGFKSSTLLRLGALTPALAEHEPWRLLSAVFVHVSLLHVVMNLWVFVDLGRGLERDLGGARFALIFLVTGVLGFMLSDLWYPAFQLTAGASGGVFGEIGALIGVRWAHRDPEWRRLFARYLIYALLLSVLLPGVNTAAHLGGFGSGIGLGFLFGRERSRLRLEVPLRVLAAVGVVAVVLSVGLALSSPVWQGVRARELMNE